MTYKKKLIEVALPLAKINDESAREKAIRHGHPTTLHLWWARRPLSSARAIVWASLVDDPSSNPKKFPTIESQTHERKRLFEILERLVPWEAGSNLKLIEEARQEIINSCGGDIPHIIDPFGGGGTIALEAGRLGSRAITGDLNPVAVMIQRAMYDIPPRFVGSHAVFPTATQGKLLAGSVNGLADDVEEYGKLLSDRVKARVGHLYADNSEPETEQQPIAWLWVRTVESPDPSSSARVPLAGSWFVKNRKGKDSVWVNAEFVSESEKCKYSIEFNGSPNPGTLSRARGTCLATGTAITNEYIRDQGKKGNLGAEVYCRVYDGEKSRRYEPPKTLDSALESLKAVAGWQPTGSMPTHSQYMGCPRYGIDEWQKLFLPRQLLTISAFVDELEEVRKIVEIDAVKKGLKMGEHLRDGGKGAIAYAEAITTYLAFAIDRCVDRWNTLSAWDSTTEKTAHMFRMHAFQMTWTFSEVNPFARTAGGWVGQVELISKVIRNLPIVDVRTSQIDASSNLRSSGKAVLCTDPPYYDNVPYSDLSDFFYVFLRKTVGKIWPDEMATLSTPKMEELVADHERHGSNESAKEFFEKGMRDVLKAAYENADSEFPATIYYAFKATEETSSGTSSTGWETFLQGLMDSGWSVIRTWPVRTEMTNGLKTLKNMLASSIVLVCRRREISAPMASRGEFIAALKNELPAELKILQMENIAPVDLSQSSIGPGMAIYSRYSKVLESTGDVLSVRAALSLINEVLAEVLSGEESEFDADTRFAVTWFEQFGHNQGAFGDGDTLAKAKNTTVNGVVESGIAVSREGKLRLLERKELSDNWDPKKDSRLTVWETTQYLIRAIEESESKAAELLTRLGVGVGERARQLAYLLYGICDRKKWAAEGSSYNMLVTAWPEIQRLARQETSGNSAPGTLF